MKPQDRLTRYFLDVRADLLRYLTRRTGRTAAEDVLHDVWVKLRQRGDPETWKEPRAVIFATAANLATDSWRRESFADKLFAREAMQADPQCPRSDPESQADTAGHLERLEAALAELPPLCREAFLLNRLEALTHAEIADRLGVSTKSVQRYIERALRHCMGTLEP